MFESSQQESAEAASIASHKNVLRGKPDLARCLHKQPVPLTSSSLPTLLEMESSALLLAGSGVILQDEV